MTNGMPVTLPLMAVVCTLVSAVAELLLHDTCAMNKIFPAGDAMDAYNLTFQDLGADYVVKDRSRINDCFSPACPNISTVDTDVYEKKRIVIEWGNSAKGLEYLMKVQLKSSPNISTRWFKVRIAPASPNINVHVRVKFDCLTIQTGTHRDMTLVLVLWQQRPANPRYPLRIAKDISSKCTCRAQEAAIRPYTDDGTYRVFVDHVATGVVAYNATVYHYNGPRIMTTGIEQVIKYKPLFNMDVNNFGKYLISVSFWCTDRLSTPRADTICLNRQWKASIEPPVESTSSPSSNPGSLPLLAKLAIGVGVVGCVAVVVTVTCIVYLRRTRQREPSETTESLTMNTVDRSQHNNNDRFPT